MDIERNYPFCMQNEVAVTDPYEIPASKWINNISLWPPVAHGDIYEYLVNTLGPFTREGRCKGITGHSE